MSKFNEPSGGKKEVLHRYESYFYGIFLLQIDNRKNSWSTNTSDDNWSTLTLWEPEVVTDKEDKVNVAVFCFRKRAQVETRLLSGLWLDHVKYFWPPIGWEDRAVTSFPSQCELSTQRIIPGCSSWDPHTSDNTVTTDTMGMSGCQALEEWCRLVLGSYPGVSITNMTSSWSDGKAFCALIHAFRPDLVDWETVKTNSPSQWV